jgi:UDP-N-acetylmuramate--alanine ligase
LTENHFTIAVAGTHGKTSISAITAHLFKSAGKSITAFVGGIMKNYNSNLILTDPAEILLVEADEFDRSFLQIKANISILSSMDADHLDIYGHHDELRSNFRKFAENLSEDGTLILNDKLSFFEGLNRKTLSYGTNLTSDFKAEKIQIIDGQFTFDLLTPELSIEKIKMTVPGLHYVENAVAAAAVATQLGLTKAEIKQGLESFKGVERRFEFRIKNDDCVFIDDYAHHPAEINATVKAVKSLFPTKKVCGIFQPHLFSRTRDFANDFAQALDQLDETILLNIYPARELPIEGVSSEIILKKMKNKSKTILSKKEVFQHLKNSKPEVLITMGAGDIGLMVDEIELLLKK